VSGFSKAFGLRLDTGHRNIQGVLEPSNISVCEEGNGVFEDTYHFLFEIF